MNKNIADIRRDYQLQSLLEKDVDNNPFNQFNAWWDDALKSDLDEINAMTLATALRSRLDGQLGEIESFQNKLGIKLIKRIIVYIFFK